MAWILMKLLRMTVISLLIWFGFQAGASPNVFSCRLLAETARTKPKDVQFQESLRPHYQIDKETATIDLDWRHIEADLRKRNGPRQLEVILLLDGQTQKTISPGRTTERLRFPLVGQQHDVVIQFVDSKTKKIVHETYPVLLESFKSQTVNKDSFRQLAKEEPMALQLPAGSAVKNQVNSDLVRRTVELGYEKLVWTLNPEASPQVRKWAEEYGNTLDVRVEMDASGAPIRFQLFSPEGHQLGIARANEMRIQNDAAFNGNAFFWDNQFVSLASALHHPRLSEMTLDFHYGSQSPEGVIPREVRHSNGVSFHRYEDVKFGEAKSNDEYTNPNFVGWVEQYLYSLSEPETAKRRLPKAIESMERYAQWMEKNRQVHDREGHFIGYWTSNLASGADNSPRGGGNTNKENFHRVAWVDVLAQQISLYKDMARFHAALGEWPKAQAKRAKARDLQTLLNQRYWNEEKGFYFDLVPKGGGYIQDTKTPTQASFWSLLAKTASPRQVQRTVDLELTPENFGGVFPGASLASSHPEFKPEGGYWKGGRWPPTLVIMAEGFERSGRPDIAFQITRDFWAGMSEVAREYRAQNNGQDTVFEFYGVQQNADGKIKPIVGVQEGHTTRKDFTGWGKTPITYSAIRHVVGLRPVGAFLGEDSKAQEWMELLGQQNETWFNRYAELKNQPTQQALAINGFLEWNLNFDFAVGESMSLKNIVYKGQKIRSLKITKLAPDRYKLHVESEKPIALQLNRLFASEGAQKPEISPRRGSPIVTAGGRQPDPTVDLLYIPQN